MKEKENVVYIAITLSIVSVFTIFTFIILIDPVSKPKKSITQTKNEHQIYLHKDKRKHPKKLNRSIDSVINEKNQRKKKA